MRYLGMPERSVSDWLDQLQGTAYSKFALDSYNQGEALQLLELRTAEILGKPAALFFPKGMTAQFVALKVSEQLRGNNQIALHPLSHIAWDEQEAFEYLLQLQAQPVGSNTAPYTAQDLTAINTSIATAIVELPLRRAGFRLPAWQELRAISDYCKTQDIHCHMDGARLWESTHYYAKSEAQIAALFDSVYVSFYKGLGGIGGAILAGEYDFIEQCKLWRTRFAGDHFTSFPQIISALDGLDNKRPKINALVERAKEVAKALSSLSALTIPEPHTNGFLVLLKGDKNELNQEVKSLTEQTGLTLFREFNYYPNSTDLVAEIQIGHAHEQITTDEIVDYFEVLVSASG